MAQGQGRRYGGERGCAWCLVMSLDCAQVVVGFGRHGGPAGEGGGRATATYPAKDSFTLAAYGVGLRPTVPVTPYWLPPLLRPGWPRVPGQPWPGSGTWATLVGLGDSGNLGQARGPRRPRPGSGTPAASAGFGDPGSLVGLGDPGGLGWVWDPGGVGRARGPGQPWSGSGTQVASAGLRDPADLGWAQGPRRLWPGSGTRVALVGLGVPGGFGRAQEPGWPLLGSGSLGRAWTASDTWQPVVYEGEDLKLAYSSNQDWEPYTL